jgi:hypothetical protein
MEQNFYAFLAAKYRGISGANMADVANSKTYNIFWVMFTHNVAAFYFIEVAPRLPPSHGFWAYTQRVLQ